MPSKWWFSVVVIILLISHVSRGAAQESAEALSVTALEECNSGRKAYDRSIRLFHFEKSQALAEQAVLLNGQLANAHFALFCSLGEKLRIDGETLMSVFGFRRVMKELDRTLELNPDHLDALSSKGTFLIRLPALMGGDKQKGEKLLRHVIQRAPKAVSARLTLAKVYAAQGYRHDAITLATQALEIAQHERRDDLLPEAQETLAELRSIDLN